ncbi:heterokaryon incompatibility protein-domain-containing protein [Nemania diffusa]|nr:heterokaryon incompatibility protein-domain-containing protein [Nemania diffusa]
MSAGAAKASSSAKSAVTYSEGTVEWTLLNARLEEEPSLRARRANAHRPSPGEWLRETGRKIGSIQLPRENEQQFRYSELDDGEIRILRLYKSKHPDEPLRADLFKRKLEDVAGRYEALSYCWGSQKATHNIHIRDLNATTRRQRNTTMPTTTEDMWKTALDAISHIDFKIRKNLHDGLLQLRSKYKDVYLWVDAICIDQSEKGKAEKARQLAMMARIYNSASNVCVWLGEGYDGAEIAFGLVRDIMNYRNFDEMILDPKSKEAWRNLISIMKSPWFSRRWVIQEIALSRDASIHCGERSLHWDDFADAVSLLMEKIELIRNTFRDDVFDDVETTSACILVQTLCNVCRKADQGKDQGRLVSGLLDVETLVSTLLGFQATFPRDTIYSILSIAKDFPQPQEDWQQLHTPQLMVVRDKKVNPRDLFIAFVTRSICQSGSLDIICRHWAPALADDEGGETLPSWISSLSKSPFGVRGTAQGRQNGENFVAYLPHDQRRHYSASDMSQANIEMVLDDTIAPSSPEARQMHRLSGILRVEGFVLGRVVDQSEVMRGGIVPGEWVAKLGWKKEVNSENRVPDTLWRLLVADRMEKGGKPPQWYKRACLHGLVDERVSDSQGNIHPVTHTNRRISELTSQYFKRVESVVWNRRESPDPIFGLAPQGCNVSDIVCILHGCSVPVILSKHDEKTYKVVGEAYVHGMMDGVAMEMAFAYGRLRHSRH